MVLAYCGSQRTTLISFTEGSERVSYPSPRLRLCFLDHFIVTTLVSPTVLRFRPGETTLFLGTLVATSHARILAGKVLRSCPHYRRSPSKFGGTSSLCSSEFPVCYYPTDSTPSPRPVVATSIGTWHRLPDRHCC